MKKRIVIFSDSLALPRFYPEVTIVEETYPYMLRNNYEVFQFSKGGGLIHEIVPQAHYYKQYNPDYIILQCGIVDCACRAFSHKEELFFQSNFLGHVIRRFLSSTITTKRLRSIRKKSWTEPEVYMSNCKTLKEIFANIPVFALSILPVSDDYEAKINGMKNKVDQYNALLKETFSETYIDLSGIPNCGIMTDGHHLTRDGHNYVFQQIQSALKNVKL